jgi:hypothetical protein
VTPVDDILERMKRNPKGIRFKDLARVCERYFGKPRSRGSSHQVYRTPCRGDPRVNIQNAQGQAKAYQVRQVLQAIEMIRKDDVEGD